MRKPITGDNIPQAKRWFIYRFVRGDTRQRFALMLNNLMPATRDQRKKLSKARSQIHPDIDFSFRVFKEYILVTPAKPASEWTRGVIWLDTDRGFIYQSGATIDLFDSPDQPVKVEED